MVSTNKYDFEPVFNGNFSINIIGKTGSGKSILLYYLLELYSSKFKFIYFLTKNQRYTNSKTDLNNFIWENHIYYITKDNLEITLRHITDWTSQFFTNENQFKTLIILDDIGKIPKDLYSYIISSRHLNISFVILTHSLTDLDYNIRKQISHIVTTSKFKDVKEIERSLQITGMYAKEIFELNQKLHQTEIKKYLVIDSDDEPYYYIVPPSFVERYKQNQVSILHNNESHLKECIKELIRQCILEIKQILNNETSNEIDDQNIESENKNENKNKFEIEI